MVISATAELFLIYALVFTLQNTKLG